MDWRDIREIASALEDAYPNEDNLNLRFTDLRRWILGLNGFCGSPEACSEKKLEAIQAAWMEERQERQD